MCSRSLEKSSRAVKRRLKSAHCPTCRLHQSASDPRMCVHFMRLHLVGLTSTLHWVQISFCLCVRKNIATASGVRNQIWEKKFLALFLYSSCWIPRWCVEHASCGVPEGDCFIAGHAIAYLLVLLRVDERRFLCEMRPSNVHIGWIPCWCVDHARSGVPEGDSSTQTTLLRGFLMQLHADDTQQRRSHAVACPRLKKYGPWFCYLTQLHRFYAIAWLPGVMFKNFKFPAFGT